VTLRTTWENEQLILIQSVEGHAHEGHGVFRGRRFVNTTLDDICWALRLDPVHVQRDRQALIDQVAGYVDRALAGNGAEDLLHDDGEPLLGISSLRFLRVDPAQVLRGIYLGGLRDDPDMRWEMERQHGLKIGGGALYLVDLARAEELGLSGEDLAHGEWHADIERFRDQGIIVGVERRQDPDVSYQYIRHRRGSGASDDTAIVAAGLLWGLGAAVGVFLTDAIDTLEKYVPVYTDQDKELALRVEARFPGLGVGRQEALELIRLQAIPDNAPLEVPDSSLRHMLSVDRHADRCPLEAHLCAVQGQACPPVGLARERTDTARFHEYVRRRVEEIKGTGPAA